MLPEKSRVRVCKRNSSADNQVSEEGEGRGRHCSWDSPKDHGAAHGEAAVLLQPMEDHMDAEIHLQTVKETHTRAGGCPKEAVTLWGGPVLEKVPCWQGPANPGREEPTPEQVSW